MDKLQRLVAVLFIGLIANLTWAESHMVPAAEESLQRAQAAANEAMTTYTAHYPDRPLWREAIAYALEARRQDPRAIEPLRFLAEAYTTTRWYGRAWRAWLDYLGAGGALDDEARSSVVEVGGELGFISYSLGDKDEALRYYRRVIDLVPEDTHAYVWTGRILLETERPGQAIAYWQEVVDRDPDDARARFFLELAQDQDEWGVEAANAFREGVARYEEGDLSAARERFARATSANAEYAAAWAWLGRVEFERGNYRNARSAYARAVQLEPDNETYQYFHRESERRLRGGAANE